MQAGLVALGAPEMPADEIQQALSKSQKLIPQTWAGARVSAASIVTPLGSRFVLLSRRIIDVRQAPGVALINPSSRTAHLGPHGNAPEGASKSFRGSLGRQIAAAQGPLEPGPRPPELSPTQLAPPSGACGLAPRAGDVLIQIKARRRSRFVCSCGSIPPIRTHWSSIRLNHRRHPGRPMSVCGTAPSSRGGLPLLRGMGRRWDPGAHRHCGRSRLARQAAR